MKKFFIGFWTFVIFCTPVWAQNIDSNTFAKVVDKLNCKLVEYSIGGKDNINAEAFRSKCNCDQSPGYDVIAANIPKSLTSTLELSKEINLIKRRYSSAWKSNDVVSYLKDTALFTTTTLKKFNDKHKSEQAYIDILNGIEAEVTSLSTPPANPAQTNPSSSPASDAVTDTPPQQPTVFTIPVIVLIVVVSILVIATILIIRSISSTETPEYIKEYVRGKLKDINKPVGNLNSNASTNTILYEVNRTLDSKLNEYSSAIAKLQREILELQSKTNNASQYRTPANDATNSRAIGEEIFYLSTPNTDGSFDNNDASQTYKDGASIYRFVKVSSTRAQFYIEDREDSIQRALQYPDKRIDPVCEAQNAFNARSKSIKTVTPGEVELVGDKWVISFNRKAKIRYE